MFNTQKLLIVDDVEVNRAIIHENFQDLYTILEAENGQEALEILEKEKDNIVIVLLDVVMPVMDGFKFMEQANDLGLLEKIPVILITGDYTIEAEKNGYRLGVSDVVVKPFNTDVIRRRVQNIVELFINRRDLENQVRRQTLKIKEQADKLLQSNDQLIDALSIVTEFRDFESGEHIYHIKAFVRIMLKALKKLYPEYEISDYKADMIVKASAMHDIGKVAIPDAILLKPGKLTPEEFEEMKLHTVKGCEILEKFDFIYDDEFYQLIYEICRSHHEKYDGKGYPDGLEGEDIPIWVQIVSVADVYDALTSKRIYKDAFAHDRAIEMIKNGECGAFSEKMIKCLEMSEEEFKKVYEIRH